MVDLSHGLEAESLKKGAAAQGLATPGRYLFYSKLPMQNKGCRAILLINNRVPSSSCHRPGPLGGKAGKYPLSLSAHRRYRLTLGIHRETVMTDDELRNLMIGSCYIKQTIPGPVRLSSISTAGAGQTDFLKAGGELVRTGYLRQHRPTPDTVQDLDDILGSFELTPLGIESFEDKLKKPGQPTPFGRMDAATVVIQFPWFGGKASYNDNSHSESSTTSTDITLRLQVALGDIVEQIEKSKATPEEKADAKSKLKAFLKHPLVIALAGAAVKPLAENL